MGRKIVLTDVTLTDLGAPKLTSVDAIESDGSLILIDPMHPSQKWAAGIPAQDNTRPNVLGSTLQSLSGNADVDVKYQAYGLINDGTVGKIERSSKGGLHGIVSMSETLALGTGATFLAPLGLRQYVFAHLSNDYYISAWGDLTRVGVAGPRIYGTEKSVETDTIANLRPDSWLLPPGAGGTIGQRLGGNIPGNFFASIAVNAATFSNGSSDHTCGPMWGGYWNTINQGGMAGNQGKWVSHVFYRFYIEDLTASGRTYAEVDALDQAMYTKEVLTTGGRYYGDTFTDPATIP